MNIRNMLKKYKHATPLIFGMSTVLMGYLAWAFWTISYQASLYKGLGFLFTVIAMCLYVLMAVSLDTCMDKWAISKQLLSISGIGAIVFLLLLMTTAKYQILRKEYLAVLIEILWIIVLAGSAVYLQYKYRFAMRFNVRKELYRHRGIYILLVVTAGFLIEPDIMQFKWDGLLYYLTCRELNIESLSSLAIYGHIAQTYGMLNGLGVLITGNTAITLIAVNCVLMFISICAFYGLLKTAITGRKEWEYALFTAVYAWSPFLLGMVYYHSLDFVCQCFFPIVLYCLYRKKWIYFSIASFMFCFTKEPAVVIYGMMCVGIVIIDFALDSPNMLMARFRGLFMRKKYYLMILPGILWVVTYKLLGPWSAGEGSFAIDWEYVLEKLKALYVFNFNWVFSIVCICGLFFIVIYRKRNVCALIFPMLCSQIGLTLFSCLFKTVNHIRYTDTNQIVLYSMGIILLCCFGKVISRIFSGVMGALLLLSSFRTVDPITKICFPVYCVGTQQMVTTMDHATPLGDGMIYNRQMLGMEGAMRLALEDALEEGDDVLFPAVGNSTYFFDGMAGVRSFDESYQIEYEYWNPVKRRREPVPNDETEEFQVYHLAEDTDWDELENIIEGKVNLIYMSFAGEQYVDEIKRRYTVIAEESYDYRGWKLDRICFEMN